MLPHLLLEQQAERCIKLAYQCQNKNAERFLRLLAVDLMLAAQLRKPPEPAKPERPAEPEAAAKPDRDKPQATAKPADTAKEQPDALSELALLSRRMNGRGVAPRRATPLTPESASTA